MLLMGDFHQFPLVGNSSAALYCSRMSRNTSIVGRAIYSQFDTVVTLVKQEQMTDEVWKHLLQRARVSECTKEDIAEVRKLVFTNPECQRPDFSKAPWSESLLVTHWNAIHAAWNRAAIRKHCQNTSNLLYICDAEDMAGDGWTTLTNEQKVIVASMKLTETKKPKALRSLDTRLKLQ